MKKRLCGILLVLAMILCQMPQAALAAEAGASAEPAVAAAEDEALAANIKDAEFKVLCADVMGPTGELLFQPYQVYTTGTGLKIGFFGIITGKLRGKAEPYRKLTSSRSCHMIFS